MQIDRCMSKQGGVIMEPGIDLLSIEDTSEIEALLKEHLVVVFPEQRLSDEMHVQFMHKFGEDIPNPKFPGIPSGVLYLENEANFGEHWHFDHPFIETVPRYFSLHCTIPNGGVAFANMISAFESLDEIWKEMLRKIDAWFSTKEYDHMLDMIGFSHGNETSSSREGGRGNIQRAKHPVVFCEDGIESIWHVHELTDKWEPFTWGQDRPLRALLREVTTNPEFMFVHNYSKRDLVLAENRRLLHHTIYGERSSPRRVKRVVIQ